MPSYSERAKLCSNRAAKMLLELMDKKQTNLSVAADLLTKRELLNLADIVGPEICLLKTHIDIVEDFDNGLIIELQRLSEKHNFLIFEDRKFADIGNTVAYQYQNGIYHIADWAHISNAHSVPGPGIIEGLKKIGLPKGRALLLLAEMSSEGNLAQGIYTEKTLSMAEQHRDFVIGFITTKAISKDPSFINLTPGVQFGTASDSLKQNYQDPELAIMRGADIIIVGRGIYASVDPADSAQNYRQKAWEAYQKRESMNAPASTT